MSTRLTRAVSLLLQKNPNDSNRGPFIAYISCDQRRKHSWDAQKSPHTHAQSLQSCLMLCNSMDCNSPGSFVHGILLSRVLEWVAIPFSRKSPTEGQSSKIRKHDQPTKYIDL